MVQAISLALVKVAIDAGALDTVGGRLVLIVRGLMLLNLRRLVVHEGKLMLWHKFRLNDEGRSQVCCPWAVLLRA